MFCLCGDLRLKEFLLMFIYVLPSQLLQTLEFRLNALSNMNSQLKNENDVLKDKIKQLENEVSNIIKYLKP